MADLTELKSSHTNERRQTVRVRFCLLFGRRQQSQKEEMHTYKFEESFEDYEKYFGTF